MRAKIFKLKNSIYLMVKRGILSFLGSLVPEGKPPKRGIKNRHEADTAVHKVNTNSEQAKRYMTRGNHDRARPYLDEVELWAGRLANYYENPSDGEPNKAGARVYDKVASWAMRSRDHPNRSSPEWTYKAAAVIGVLSILMSILFMSHIVTGHVIGNSAGESNFVSVSLFIIGILSLYFYFRKN